MVGSVGDGEDVGWHLVSPLADVHPDGGLRVDGESAIRVHGHAEQTRVGLGKKESGGRVIQFKIVQVLVRIKEELSKSDLT